VERMKRKREIEEARDTGGYVVKRNQQVLMSLHILSERQW